MKSILITGANGFLGKHLTENLVEKGYFVYPLSREFLDLRDKEAVDSYFANYADNLDYIYHCAADVGGLQYNIDNGPKIFNNNVTINDNVIKASYKHHPKAKFIFVSSACVYDNYDYPVAEDKLLFGSPEISNHAYGTSKRMAYIRLLAMGDYNFEYPILSNMYGPGDKSDHVIPSLIKKAIIAKKHRTDLEVWGDPETTRDFLYVKDAAEALSRFTEIDLNEPVNIASDHSVNISSLARKIAGIIGLDGDIVFDPKKPKGQSYRAYDISKAREKLEWYADYSLIEGLRETCNYY